MSEIIVRAEPRTTLGKNANRRLRGQGRIPAVVYGRRMSPQAVTVDPREVDRILHSEAGHNTIFKLQVDGALQDVIIRDYQLDPVKDKLLHADFQAIAMDETMSFDVPVEVVGSARGVQLGGILDLVLREIEVECLPGDVPDHIRVDVSQLEIGDALRVSDLPVDTSRITVLSEPELVVLTVVPPLAEEVEEEVPVEVEEEAEPEVIKKGKVEKEKEEEEKEEEKEE